MGIYYCFNDICNKWQANRKSGGIDFCATLLTVIEAPNNNCKQTKLRLPKNIRLREGRRLPEWRSAPPAARPSPELVALADLTTEMRPVKHYYEPGVPARRCIE